MLAETDGSGTATRRYTHAPEGLDFPLAMRQSSTTSLFHLDGQGNVYLLTNTAGTRRSEYRYRAFGDRYVTPVGEAVQSPFGYKAREEDRETGLIHMRHRYYSPRLERFLNQDPIGIAGGLNTYAFGAAEPINRGDPFGLCGWEFQGRVEYPNGHAVTTGIYSECASERGLANGIWADFWRDFTKFQYARLPYGTGSPLAGDFAVTSPFGRRKINAVSESHSGIDIAADEGTPIYSICYGVVSKASENRGRLGSAVTTVNGGWALHYGHMSKIEVEVGDTVYGGDLLGLSGRTGRASGPHLHFGVGGPRGYYDPMTAQPACSPPGGG